MLWRVNFFCPHCGRTEEALTLNNHVRLVMDVKVLEYYCVVAEYMYCRACMLRDVYFVGHPDAQPAKWWSPSTLPSPGDSKVEVRSGTNYGLLGLEHEYVNYLVDPCMLQERGVFFLVVFTWLKKCMVFSYSGYCWRVARGVQHSIRKCGDKRVVMTTHYTLN